MLLFTCVTFHYCLSKYTTLGIHRLYQPTPQYTSAYVIRAMTSIFFSNQDKTECSKMGTLYGYLYTILYITYIMYEMWVYLPYCKFVISLSSVLQVTRKQKSVSLKMSVHNNAQLKLFWHMS